MTGGQGLAQVAWQPRTPGPPDEPSANVPGGVTLTWTTGAENRVRDGGFEAGLAGPWGVRVIGNAHLRLNYGPPESPQLPLAGGASVLMTGIGTAELSQVIDLCGDATSAVLTWLMRSDGPQPAAQGSLTVEIRDLEDHGLGTVFAAEGVAMPWQTTRRGSANLTEFVGRQVKLTFVMRLTAGAGALGAIQLDELGLVTAPIPNTRFAVYLAPNGTSVSESDFRGETEGLTWPGGDLLPSRTYAWRVVTLRGTQRIPGPLWRFRTGAAGRLDHLEIGTVSSPQFEGEPIPLNLKARDARELPPTNPPRAGTSGSIVGVLGEGQAASSLVLTELLLQGTNGVEVLNVGARPVDLRGWSIVTYDAVFTDLTGPRFEIPGAHEVPPGGVFVLRFGGRAPGVYPDLQSGSPFVWQRNATTVGFGAALLDARSNVVDFVAVGTLNPGLVARPSRLGLGDWVGPTVPARSGNVGSLRRWGDRDRQSAEDWFYAEPSIGRLNEDLEPVFRPGVGLLPSAPTLVTNQTTGEWTTQVVVSARVPRARLVAREDGGRGGFSPWFEIASTSRLAIRVPPVIVEKAGPPLGKGALVLRSPVAEELWVNLRAEPAGFLTLPEQVVIPAGATNVEFPLRPVDNSRRDGPVSVSITGAAEGFEVVPARTEIQDDEPTDLALQVPTSIREGQTLGAALSLSTPAARDLVVALTCEDSTVVRLPDSVVVPAGQTRVDFDVTAVADDLITGPRTVRIEAQVSGWPVAVASLQARDDEARTLAVKLPVLVLEGAGVQTGRGRLELSGRAGEDLRVELTTDRPEELVVPASVTIPAGASSVAFDLEAPEEAAANGTQNVQVTAEVRAEGFTPVMQSVPVEDNDPDHFEVVLGAGPRFGGSAFPLTLRAVHADGTALRNFTEPVALRAVLEAGEVAIEPAQIPAGVGSQWNGIATIRAAGPGVRVIAEGAGARGESPPFRLLSSPVLQEWKLAVGDMVWDATRRRLLVSVLGTDEAYPDRVLFIDPTAGVVESELAVGPISAPPALGDAVGGKLALSKGGRHLYVATRENTLVRQYDLTDRHLVREFTLGATDFGVLMALADMEVLPTDPEVLVVAQSDPERERSVRVYRQGIPRPVRGPATQQLALGSDGVTGYGFFRDALQRFQFDDTGVVRSEVLAMPDAFPPWWGGQMKWEGGLLYFSSGRVFDPTRGVVPGDFPVKGLVRQFDNPGRLDFDSERGQVWFVSGDGGTGQVLDVMDRTSLHAWRSVGLPMIPGVIQRFRACGDEALAMFTGERLFLLRSPLFLPRGIPANLGLSTVGPSQVATTWQSFSYTLVVTNQGPAPATDVVLTEVLPAEADFLASVVSQGRAVWVQREIRAELGDLAPGTTALLTLTITPRSGGLLESSAGVVANEWDDALEDNRFRRTTPVRLGLGPNDAGDLAFRALGLAVDPVSGTLFASTADTDPRWLGRIVVLEAETGQYRRTLDLGPGIGLLKATDDGRYLYAIADAGAAVVRYDLLEDRADFRVSLGGRGEGWIYRATDLFPVPGRSRSVAVIRLAELPGTGTGPGGVVVFDDGLARPKEGYDAESSILTEVGFSVDGSHLWAASAFTGTLERYAVTPEGLRLTDRQPNLVDGQQLGYGVRFDPNRQLFYTVTGSVIDPISAQVAARMPLRVVNAPLAVHARAACVVVVNRFSSDPGVDVYDQTGLVFLGHQSIPGLDDFADPPLAFGADRLAFRQYNGKVLVVRSSLLLPEAGDPDGDGLPTEWETRYGTQPRVADADGDLDADGLTNAEEYLVGTRPDDARSAPRVDLREGVGDGRMIEVLTSTGRTYQLWRRAEGAGPWEPASAMVRGTGDLVRFPFDEHAAHSAWYQVRVAR